MEDEPLGLDVAGDVVALATLVTGMAVSDPDPIKLVEVEVTMDSEAELIVEVDSVVEDVVDAGTDVDVVVDVDVILVEGDEVSVVEDVEEVAEDGAAELGFGLEIDTFEIENLGDALPESPNKTMI